VARSQRRGADRAGLAQQQVELDLVVAGDAGVGSSARLVVAEERLHHPRLELLLDVEYVIRDLQAGGHPAGVLDGIE